MAGISVALTDVFMGALRPKKSEPCVLRRLLLVGVPAYLLYRIGKRLVFAGVPMLAGIPIRGANVVVTGASEGIGAALGEVLAEKGAARVFLLARTQAKLQNVADTIETKHPGVAVVCPVNCSDPAAVSVTAKHIMGECPNGAPDVLVNCAGAGRWTFLHDMPEEEIRDCLDAPYLAAAYTSRAFLPAMVKHNRGAIVNVQSPAGYSAWPGATAYIAARWALRGLGEALRADLYGFSITVQDVVFGEVSSNYFKANQVQASSIPWIASMLIPTLTPRQAAEHLAVAIERGETLHVRPVMLRVILALHSLMPGVVNYLVVKTAGAKWSRESV